MRLKKDEQCTRVGRKEIRCIKDGRRTEGVSNMHNTINLNNTKIYKVCTISLKNKCLLSNLHYLFKYFYLN